MLCAAYYHPSQSAPVIYVWNPLTEQSRQLLWPARHTAEENFANSTLLGFGYDHVADDFKIVVHINNCKTTPATRTYSMALKTNEWRILDRSPRGLPNDCLVSINGDLYWITCYVVNQNAVSENKYWLSQWMRNKWWGYSIVKFKLSNETWEIVDCPPKGRLRMGYYWRAHLGQYKCFLCLYNYTSYHRRSRGKSHQMHTWTMCGSPWNILMSLPEAVLGRSTIPLGFTSAGELALRLFSDHGILFYDPETENFEARVFCPSIVDEMGREHLGRMVTYLLLDFDTLISPNY